MLRASSTLYFKETNITYSPRNSWAMTFKSSKPQVNQNSFKNNTRSLSTNLNRKSDTWSALQWPHNIYIIGQDENYLYAIPRTHGFPKYDPRLEGFKIKSKAETLLNGDEEIKPEIIRLENTWIYGSDYNSNIRVTKIYVPNNGKCEYVSRDIVLGIPLKDLAFNISFKNFSEINKEDIITKGPNIEEYQMSIKKAKDLVLIDQNNKKKDYILAFLVDQKIYK